MGYYQSVFFLENAGTKLNVSYLAELYNRLVILKDPIDVIFSELDCKIGVPEDIKKLVSTGCANFDVEFPIPHAFKIQLKKEFAKPS